MAAKRFCTEERGVPPIGNVSQGPRALGLLCRWVSIEARQVTRGRSTSSVLEILL